MKPRPKLIVPVLVVILAAGGGAWWYLHRQHDAAIQGNTLVLHGNVDIRQVELAFNGSERIARMQAEEGDRVQQGQVVAELDTVRLQQAVDQAQARVEAQEATVARLKAGARPQEIAKLRAEVQAAKYQAENAERTARRQADLLERDLTSKEQADNAQTAADAARANLRAANEALQLALAGTRQEDIDAAEAELRADRAALALTRQQLDDATLRAPADAVVEQRLLQPGDMASPQKPVYTLALTDPLWVRAYVGETELGHVQPGMRAEVHTDTFPDRAYKGWIGYVSPTAEFTPKSVQTRDVRTDLVYQVRVMVCNPRGELRLGMPATVTIPLDQGEPAAEPTSSRCGNG